MEISGSSSVSSLDSIQISKDTQVKNQAKNLKEQTDRVQQKLEDTESVNQRVDSYREEQESIETQEANDRQEFSDDVQTGRNLDYTA